MPYVNTYEEIGEQNTLDRLVANTLTSFTDDRIRVIGRGAFLNSNLEELRLPNCKYINDSLRQSYSLKRLILDINDGALCNIDIDILYLSTPRLIVYVPDELVDAYKSINSSDPFYNSSFNTRTYTISPWVSKGFADRIYGISQIGGTQEWLEQEITDSWETIGAHISAGDATETYHLGMYKPVNLGSEGTINFQIVGFNQDTISGTNSTAQLTWCAMTCLGSDMEMNAAMDGDTLGTGTNGGWPYCSIRAYLANTVFPMLPSNVSTLIKSVDKVSIVRDPTITDNDKCTDVVSSDKLFLFSARELFLYTYNSNYIEGSGPIYSIAFGSNSAHMRTGQVGASVGPRRWWLRSVSRDVGGGSDMTTQANWKIVDVTGGVTNSRAQDGRGIIFGFCT